MNTDPSELSDRELDGLVEERFFSNKVHWKDEEPFLVDEDHPTGINLEFEVYRYSTDIDAAWRIIDTARHRGWTVQVNLEPERVLVVILSKGGTELSRATAMYTPRALAEAIVKL